MWVKNTCVIKKIVINDADSLISDPDVLKHIENINYMNTSETNLKDIEQF